MLLGASKTALATYGVNCLCLRAALKDPSLDGNTGWDQEWVIAVCFWLFSENKINQILTAQVHAKTACPDGGLTGFEEVGVTGSMCRKISYLKYKNTPSVWEIFYLHRRATKSLPFKHFYKNTSQLLHFIVSQCNKTLIHIQCCVNNPTGHI